MDPRKLVEELRQEAESAARREELAPLSPVDPVQQREELARINRTWPLDRSWSDEVRPGWLRALRMRARRFIALRVFQALERYLDSERAFHQDVVRFQNELANEVDRLGEEIRSTAAALRSETESLRRRQDVLHGLLEDRLERLERDPGKGK